MKSRARSLSESVEWWYRDRYRLPATDPRFLDLTYDEMELDAWAAYFDGARKDGKGTLIEDDNFDLDEILANLEREAEERERQKALDAPDDQWEPAEEWSVDKQGSCDD